MTRQSLLVFLVGLNLFLLGALVLSVYTPPAAHAQAEGQAGGAQYLLLSGRVQAGHDNVYLLDSRNRLLHTFQSSIGQPIVIRPVHTRELARDFRAPPR